MPYKIRLWKNNKVVKTGSTDKDSGSSMLLYANSTGIDWDKVTLHDPKWKQLKVMKKTGAESGRGGPSPKSGTNQKINEAISQKSKAPEFKMLNVYFDRPEGRMVRRKNTHIYREDLPRNVAFGSRKDFDDFIKSLKLVKIGKAEVVKNAGFNRMRGYYDVPMQPYELQGNNGFKDDYKYYFDVDNSDPKITKVSWVR